MEDGGERGPDVEEPLEGGRVTGGVVRVGDTVRRPTGPWTPTVHAFLRHLEAEGFDGAPRALGVDERGREVLSFVPGLPVGLHVVDLLADDRNVARVGRLVRDFHRASASFPLPSTAPLWAGALDPCGGPLMLHNDLAPWNIVADPESDRWAIIDWDGAGPGRPEWELAYLLHTVVPLWPDSGLTDEETLRRMIVLADGYGMNRSLLAASLRLAALRCRVVAEAIEDEAERGHPAFAQMRAEGDVANWAGAADHIDSRLDGWLRRLSSADGGASGAGQQPIDVGKCTDER